MGEQTARSTVESALQAAGFRPQQGGWTGIIGGQIWAITLGVGAEHNTAQVGAFVPEADLSTLLRYKQIAQERDALKAQMAGMYNGAQIQRAVMEACGGNTEYAGLFTAAVLNNLKNPEATPPAQSERSTEPSPQRS